MTNVYYQALQVGPNNLERPTTRNDNGGFTWRAKSILPWIFAMAHFHATRQHPRWEDRIDKALAMRRDGKSFKDISLALFLPKSTLYR